MRAYRDRRHPALTLVLTVALAGCAQAATGPEPPPEPAVAWAWEMPRCAAYRPESYSAPPHRVSVSATSGGTITEEYQPGWGTTAVAEIRAVVQTCGSFEYGADGDPEAFLEQNTVVENGFAGDESLLVETVRLRPPAPVQTSYTAVVRSGDVVVTWRTSGLDATETLCLAGALLATCASGRT